MSSSKKAKTDQAHQKFSTKNRLEKLLEQQDVMVMTEINKITHAQQRDAVSKVFEMYKHLNHELVQICKIEKDNELSNLIKNQDLLTESIDELGKKISRNQSNLQKQLFG